MFEDEKNLYSLSSGYHAHEDIEKNLINAEVIGRKQQEQFVSDRIKTKKVSFYYPIKKNKLKTFSMNTSKISSKTGKALVERDMFNRVLVAHEFAEEDISLKELLSFFLSPVALSLYSLDGSLCKASLLHRFEESIPFYDLQSLADAVQIFDAMVIKQQISASVNTFGDISDYILNQVMKYPAPKIFFVTDQYNRQSIKSFEREKRAITGVIRVAASRRDQPRPKQLKKYLSHGTNKIELVQFLLKD